MINLKSYFAEKLEELWFAAGTCQLLIQQLALDCLVFVLESLVGVGKVNLLDELSEQVPVEVRAKFFR